MVIRKKRHSWVKLRIHVYMCRSCGCGYENKQTAGGEWYREYYRPDGRNEVSTYVPSCERGIRTDAALRKYADACQARNVPQAPAVVPVPSGGRTP